MLNFYNKNGKPLAYCDDNTNLFSFSGKPVAYLHGGLIYSFNGRHLGFFVDGWIRDLNGYCVFFTENSIGGVIKPNKLFLPVCSTKEIIPTKTSRQLPRTILVKRNSWSKYEGLEFFLE